MGVALPVRLVRRSPVTRTKLGPITGQKWAVLPGRREMDNPPPPKKRGHMTVEVEESEVTSRDRRNTQEPGEGWRGEDPRGKHSKSVLCPPGLAVQT